MTCSDPQTRIADPSSLDELTLAAIDALCSLPPNSKANFLLDTSIALIGAGHYGPKVENYLDVYLRTPRLPHHDAARALIARGNARRAAGQCLLGKSHQDYQSASLLDPSNRELQSVVRRDKLIHFSNDVASRRAPPEIWERIARYIPRYHLRTWLFVSSFLRDIATRLIFRTLDLYFGEDLEGLHRGLDILDRVRSDPVFANRVKVLRIHWSYEEGEPLELVSRMFRAALPEFKALREFEWIGYPEMRADMVSSLLASHPHIRCLGLMGWHFDAEGVSAFRNLYKFTLRAEDDDGFADIGEVRTVLDRNDGLRHLCLGAYLKRDHSWDNAFQSSTIKNLTQLDLVDTRISSVVLARIAHAHNLRGLTLHGTFEQTSSASVMFSSDHIIDEKHTFLPYLENFRLVLVDHDDDYELFEAVVHFLRRRKRIRKLDLGCCPWRFVMDVLPELTGLRVLRVQFSELNQDNVRLLAKAIPKQMVAIHITAHRSAKPINEFTSFFSIFPSLSFLHLRDLSIRRPQPNLLSEKDFRVQTDIWISSAQSVAVAAPSLDFMGWHGEHYVIARSCSTIGCPVVDLRELPARRRLDCGKGVDLGSEDAAWLERKDVPMDYEMTEMVGSDV
ncbi:hypothetical protein SERLA73DRAFT_114070 [Serpula lacrymans var. lacrymans S7.3]|uniref:F-box domain-containing protein n=2 Tax=Serpula lacrymans var. lacrymans TaxID=341189 RepID=F8QA30_SERL3|nr:uncharacterized protein SERLADRAFT_452841 [Serpula lacrymans var. lacrymans S7.9]EGN94620.1 hypothetical protein SERLA73DRAFT_114070 [Serpula lacrymans var. lacrymans S7.3]EGO20100.1 hypothetical protein SERLADRAFT_452841 [Serpula lacrymans var. lacrymans S7.9]